MNVSSDSIVDRIPNPVWSILAFVGSFLVPYLTVAGNPTPAFERIMIDSEFNRPMSLAEILGGDVSTFRVGSMYHFGGQLVNTDLVLPSGLHESVNPVLRLGGPYLLFLLVPPVALIIAGMMATRNVRTPLDFTFDFGAGTWQRYAVNGGLHAVLGYGMVALVVMLVQVRYPQPNMVVGLFVATLIYPLVFGGLGGAIMYRLSDGYETGKRNAHYAIDGEAN